MNENKLNINSWIDKAVKSVEELAVSAADITDDLQFYHLFEDDENSYDADSFSFSQDLDVENGAPTGIGLIIKKKRLAKIYSSKVETKCTVLFILSICLTTNNALKNILSFGGCGL